MTIAPEPQLRACLRVIYIVTLEARMDGWNGDVNAERLADMMDAIHNIPYLIQNWEHCDESLLRNKLMSYEHKWSEKGPCLMTIYEQELARQSD